MPNYKGRRPGTRRIVIWTSGAPTEWIIEGTKADGDQFEAQKRLELGMSGTSRKGAEQLLQIFRAYSVHAKVHLKESTWDDVRVYQVATLSGFFGNIRSDKLTVSNVDAFKRLRLKEVQPSSVNNELRVLRRILNWARQLYLVADVKWQFLKARTSDRVKYWTKAELERIFAACREKYPLLLPMFVFLANTGCRKGEAIAARWDWFDFDRANITIPASRLWQPKSGRSRDVPMSDALRAHLLGPRRHPEIAFPTIGASRKSKPRQYEDFPKDIFWEVLRLAGVTGNPHMFRHSFAAHFLSEVPDMPLLAEILGHSTTRVTEIYAHFLPQKLERARNAVNLGTPTMAVPWRKEPGTPVKAG